jgi:hypothetical protein
LTLSTDVVLEVEGLQPLGCLARAAGHVAAGQRFVNTNKLGLYTDEAKSGLQFIL